MDDNPTLDLDAVWEETQDTTIRFTHNSESFYQEVV